MSSLERAYEYIKNSPKLILLCDLYVQISLFGVVGLLGLGFLHFLLISYFFVFLRMGLWYFLLFLNSVRCCTLSLTRCFLL